MTKVLVIGKSGFISLSFQKYMMNFGNNYVIDVISSRNRKWENFSFSGYDTVFNASGLAHTNARNGSEEEYYEVNGDLPGELAAKAKLEGVHHFITMSSMNVYGDMANIGVSKCITDSTVPNTQSIYGKSKLMGETAVKKLEDDNFKVAIIRPPLVFSEYAPDNFGILLKIAVLFPVFPNIRNNQSMIYVDNLCELVRLIIDNHISGIFYPQEKEYIHTSTLVKDIAIQAGHKILMTEIFNSALMVLSKDISIVRKAFGNLTYHPSISNHFNWNYCVVDYKTAVKRMAEHHGSVKKCK
ncbi:MAG: NAD-dependent epimerase/dehydratase family protein [Sedimentibacter saalensis]|uniref:NAD-dependent epimerase/dehydratase family protein n=1 Tax=Sedimentibacter saalensis TaxID=130788 RepID=UPI002B1EE735|nr:NAD-dependent epimerase/dehydratase family protein [Sedimentibacter saalensis]MEA5093486.1 NAD-dependent epimerase/dehydratase family protein [Sedimentibacter saalensis]